MASPIRIEYAGALYHITSRGNAREAIFLIDKDRLSFLKILQDLCESINWVCHAYCLMDNHYHLLIETPDGNLIKGNAAIKWCLYTNFQPTPQSGWACISGEI